MVEVLAPEDLVDDWSDLSTSDLGPGARLGRYELLLPIAYGGMARVWAARMHGMRGFQKLVAIKTILPHLARDPEFERMFLDEARIASGVHHPNVCEIYELGEEGHALYLVMEWVMGESLVHILRPGGGNTRPGAAVASQPIDPRLAAKICADACAGLHAAHNLTDDEGRPLNVVHRDVSPHNVLVSIDGHVKVADFGVAKALGQSHNATVAGQVKGKVAYMSPEQISGAAPMDRRSDVYSMGCLIYEATTGVQPFRGENDPQVMQAVLRGQYALPTKVVRGYPAELEAIVARALAPEPRLRFADAEKMRVALEEWLVRSGPLVTPSQVGALVRERAGAEIERRREWIRRASAEGATSWPSAGSGHTPSGGRAGSRSGVVPAAGGTASMPARGPAAGFPVAAAPPAPPSAYPAAVHVPPRPPPHSNPPMAEGGGQTVFTPDVIAPGFGPTPPSGPRAPQMAQMSPLPPPVVGPAAVMAPVPGYAVPPMRAPLPSATGPQAAQPAGPGQPPVLPVQPRGNSGYIFAALAGLVIAGLLAGGGLIAWRFLRAPAPAALTSGPIAATTPATTAAPPPAQPASPPTQAAATQVTPATSAPAASAAVSSDIDFQLMPETSYLVIDGVPQPPSLRTIPRPAHGTTLKVAVRAPGYKDDEVVIDDTAASPVLVILSGIPPQLPQTGGGYVPPAATTPPASTGGIVLPPNPYRHP